jgi:hypothetical protein
LTYWSEAPNSFPTCAFIWSAMFLLISTCVSVVRATLCG